MSPSRTALLVTFLLAATTAGLANEPAHHRDDGFANPLAEPRSGGLLTVLRSMLFSDEWQSYDPERDIVPTSTPELARETTDNATVTWLGHATVLIQHRGINVLSDPMFSERASPLSWIGPKRITRPAVAIEDLPPIHAVVISHDHYDHLDEDSIAALGDMPTYFVPLGLEAFFTGLGIAADRVVEMDWWDERPLTVDGQALRVVATPSQHFSGRGLTDRNRTLWASWSIIWPDFHAWFGGDTGYNDTQFKEIAARLPDVDLGIIPIGAYEPRKMMGPIHVNPAEAVLIHQDLEAAASMPIHWGAFVLSAEGVLTPAMALAEALEQSGVPEAEFPTFAVGETRHYPPRRADAQAADRR